MPVLSFFKPFFFKAFAASVHARFFGSVPIFRASCAWPGFSRVPRHIFPFFLALSTRGFRGKFSMSVTLATAASCHCHCHFLVPPPVLLATFSHPVFRARQLATPSEHAILCAIRTDGGCAESVSGSASFSGFVFPDDREAAMSRGQVPQQRVHTRPYHFIRHARFLGRPPTPRSQKVVFRIRFQMIARPVEETRSFRFCSQCPGRGQVPIR